MKSNAQNSQRKLSVIFKYGTHQRQTHEKSLAACGDSYNQLRFVHRDCLDNNCFVNLGKTSRGTALSMMSKLQRIKILMVTELSDSVCESMGVEKISMDRAKIHVKHSSGSLAAIPNADLLIKRSAGCKSRPLVNDDPCLLTNRDSEAIF